MTALISDYVNSNVTISRSKKTVDLWGFLCGIQVYCTPDWLLLTESYVQLADCSVKENSNCNFTFNCTHAYTYRKPAAFVVSFGHGILIDFDTNVFINFEGSPIPTCPYARLDVMILLLIQLVFNLEMVLLLFVE